MIYFIINLSTQLYTKMHRRLYKARKHLGLTQAQIASILGIGQTAYSMIENGKISLTDRNRTTLADKLYINPIFLTEGRGDMMLPTERNRVSATEQNSPKSGVPFFSKPIQGSSSFREMINDSPEYFIDVEPFNDCNFYRPVFGESMAPQYNPSDIVACKRINNKEMILYGQAYLCFINFDGDFYETIKILRKSSTDNHVILTPCSEAFDPTTVPLDAISELYIIKGKIERNI